VEGKYDKIKLDSIIEGKIIVADGFGVFRDKEKRQMLIALSKITPIIVATDSDGAGLVIRNHLKSIIPKDRLYHVFIPEIKGKEKRKTEASKQGLLGVEGMENEILYAILEPYSVDADVPVSKGGITRADLYENGLMGGEGSAEKRKRLCMKCALPQNISTSALLEALNLLYTLEEYELLVSEL
jgi:ribonuclease M5